MKRCDHCRFHDHIHVYDDKHVDCTLAGGMHVTTEDGDTLIVYPRPPMSAHCRHFWPEDEDGS